MLRVSEELRSSAIEESLNTVMPPPPAFLCQARETRAHGAGTANQRRDSIAGSSRRGVTRCTEAPEVRGDLHAGTCAFFT